MHCKANSGNMYLRRMKLLLVSATPGEIEPTLRSFKFKEGYNVHNGHEITVLITGVGMVAMAFSMGKELAGRDFDLAINAGIAGSFNRTLIPGEVVTVKSDRFSELGAEDGDTFLSVDEMGFGNSCLFPVRAALIEESAVRLKEVSAITVNRVHGNDESIAGVISRLNPEIETMEGAAFFYACQNQTIPSVQIRSISNYVERRNRESWDIPLAVKNLNAVLADLLNKII